MIPAEISLRTMEILRGFCILCAFLFVGEGVVQLFRIPFPGSVIGMFLLLIALRWGWLKTAWVELAARVLLLLLPLLFVPLCVTLFYPPAATVQALLRYGNLSLLGTLLILLGVPVVCFYAVGLMSRKPPQKTMRKAE